MNPPMFEQAIRAAARKLAAVPGVRSAVLFGSAARGNAKEGSDIDIFIECNSGAEDPAWEALLALDRQFDVEFSVIYYRPEERDAFDKQFLESIVRQGRVLFGDLPRVTPVELDLQPLRLVSYQTDRLSPRKRARFLREIDGYRTQKRVGEKTYVVQKPGFLRDVGGWRVGRGAVIVPEDKIEAFDEILRRYRAKRHIIPIWSQRP
ncbi:MAG TPA: nucleotidyltransferase domain-containing protein [Thermoplasmata archaeon]